MNIFSYPARFLLALQDGLSQAGAGRSTPLLLGGGIVAGIAFFGVLNSLFLNRAAEQPAASAAPPAAIAEPMARPQAIPRNIGPIAEQAGRVRAAIKQRDFATAHQIVADVLGASELQNWRFYPFSDFINQISDVTDPDFETRLDEWAAAATDAIPKLVRAQYYWQIGWFRRGHNVVKEVQAGNMASFQGYMRKAGDDIDAAIAMDDGNPYSFYLKLRILHGYGAAKMLGAFQAAIAKFPSYYPLYDIVLGTLEPRWGGTVAEMYAFVDQHAGHAAEYSPLKLLYLSLYRSLLGSASFACSPYWRDKDRLAQCVALVMRKLGTADLEKPIVAALQLYDHTDKGQFDAAIEGLLIDLLRTNGGAAYAGAILQRAAAAMHSDTQLKEDKPGHNDYVIDRAVAQSWYLKGFYDNALKKDREALDDLASVAFPDEEQKSLAAARIYQDMTTIADRLHQYADMIGYEKKAISLGGGADYVHYICYGYYQLKDYRTALAECDRAIADQPSNVPARYWRGKAYEAAGQIDDAVRDFTFVADSEHDFRTSAAISLSMIYFNNKKDNNGALALLNKYQYLYDAASQTKDDLAVSYNNRCYAYMELGELQKALADCTNSLKYGSLPDALRKQQELVRRLGASDSGL